MTAARILAIEYRFLCMVVIPTALQFMLTVSESEAGLHGSPSLLC